MIKTREGIARLIDHTLLAPLATLRQVDALCDEAITHGFGAVCVHPAHVHRAVARLSDALSAKAPGHIPNVVSVVGFPLGANRTETKVAEARRILEVGATEIDLVAPLWAIAEGAESAIRRDIEAGVQEVHRVGRHSVLKVIIESAALTPDQTALACRCCIASGADFVKTSTGFHPAGGATVEQVHLLCRLAAPLPVKAAGGIRTAEQARAMVEAGATRLGTSAGVAIMEGWQDQWLHT